MADERRIAASAVNELTQSLRATREHLLEVNAQSKSAVRHALGGITTELYSRQSELARAEEALRICEGMEDADCSAARLRVGRAREAVRIAKDVLRRAENAERDLVATLTRVDDDFQIASDDGLRQLAKLRHRLDEYGSLAVAPPVSGAMRTGGGSPAARSFSARFVPEGMPAGFQMIPLSEVDIAASLVVGEADFKKGYSPDDLEWAFHALEQVVLPELALGASPDAFRERDLRANLQGTRSYSMTYSQFFQLSDAISLSQQPNGLLRCSRSAGRTSPR